MIGVVEVEFPAGGGFGDDVRGTTRQDAEGDAGEETEHPQPRSGGQTPIHGLAKWLPQDLLVLKLDRGAL